MNQNDNDIFEKYKEFKSILKTAKYYGISRNKVYRVLMKNPSYKPNKIINWSYELIRDAASKYNHRSHFMKYDRKAYTAARKRKILDDVCSHMIPLGDYYRRLVYVYEFEDNHVYVGLTCDKDKRHSEHIRDGRGPVYKHIKSTGLEPTYKMISDGYIFYKDAQLLEKETCEYYMENDWVLLNSAPAGNLGGNYYKWTEELLKEEALKYKTRAEMQRKSSSAYGIIKHRKLFHLFSHMKWEGNISHTLEECITEAKKYSTKGEFRKARYDLYQWVYQHGHSEIVFSHMQKLRVYKWNTEDAIEISKKYTTVKDFVKNDFNAHRHLQRKKNYKELTKHLIRENVRPKPWNIEDALEVSKKYQTLKEFKMYESSAFNFLTKQKNYQELTKHLKRLKSFS
jgi:hypothetical protein